MINQANGQLNQMLNNNGFNSMIPNNANMAQMNNGVNPQMNGFMPNPNMAAAMPLPNNNPNVINNSFAFKQKDQVVVNQNQNDLSNQLIQMQNQMSLLMVIALLIFYRNKYKKRKNY